MSKKINPKDNESNQVNSNDGTDGNNSAYLAAEENRKRQLEESKMKK